MTHESWTVRTYLARMMLPINITGDLYNFGTKNNKKIAETRFVMRMPAFRGHG